jgi:hypothetical protein
VFAVKKFFLTSVKTFILVLKFYLSKQRSPRSCGQIILCPLLCSNLLGFLYSEHTSWSRYYEVKILYIFAFLYYFEHFFIFCWKFEFLEPLLQSRSSNSMLLRFRQLRNNTGTFENAFRMKIKRKKGFFKRRLII